MRHSDRPKIGHLYSAQIARLSDAHQGRIRYTGDIRVSRLPSDELGLQLTTVEGR